MADLGLHHAGPVPHIITLGLSQISFVSTRSFHETKETFLVTLFLSIVLIILNSGKEEEKDLI